LLPGCLRAVAVAAGATAADANCGAAPCGVASAALSAACLAPGVCPDMSRLDSSVVTAAERDAVVLGSWLPGCRRRTHPGHLRDAPWHRAAACSMRLLPCAPTAQRIAFFSTGAAGLGDPLPISGRCVQRCTSDGTDSLSTAWMHQGPAEGGRQGAGEAEAEVGAPHNAVCPLRLHLHGARCTKSMASPPLSLPSWTSSAQGRR